MLRDLADRIHAQNFIHAFRYYISARCWGHGFDLFARAFIMTSEEGQGAKLFSGIPIQSRAKLKIIFYGFHRARGKPNHSLFIALSYNDSTALVPIEIATASFACLMDTQAR